jgi:nitrogenase molybdenum-iron protein NifN
MTRAPATTPSAAPAATSNACALCAPLGACVALRGIAGAMPILHGSQGCATYIRRYIIGHFREPIDIASSSFSEESTVFGGGENLRHAIANVISQYSPSLIGIATTCLAETIGEDVALHLSGIEATSAEPLPPIVKVSTPSYRGTHIEGYRRTVRALVDRFARRGTPESRVALFPAMVSPADLRHLRDLCADFGLPCIMVPDYAPTLDGGIWDGYCPLPEGGTTVDELVATGSCAASIEFGASAEGELSAGQLLERACGVPSVKTAPPVGVDACDSFFGVLSRLSGNSVPQRHDEARRRLVDAYVDGHKFLFGKKIAICGDEDFAPAIAAFALETGMHVTAIVSGASGKTLRAACAGLRSEGNEAPLILGDADFEDLARAADRAKPDMLIGGSKAYYLARKLSVPLVRAGFPVHDRIGAQRIRTLGYEGTLELYDRIVNAFIELEQADSPVGYTAW